MKKKLFPSLLLCFLMLCGAWGPARATTMYVSHSLAHDTTWSADTIMVVGNLVIESTAVLTIPAGTVVLFDGPWSITVIGRIDAQGTPSQPIRFTASDTTGYHIVRDVLINDIFLNKPPPPLHSYLWRGIRFEIPMFKGDTSIFRNCQFSYGFAYYDSQIYKLCDENGGALYLGDSSTVIVDSCSFYRCSAWQNGGAIFATNSSKLIISNTDFSDNAALQHGGAIGLSNSSADLFNCVFIENFTNVKTLDKVEPEHFGGAIKLSDSSTLHAAGCYFEGNTSTRGGAIHGSWGASVVLDSTSFLYNHSEGKGGAIFLCRGAEWEGPISTLDMYRCLFMGNSAGYDISYYLIDPGKWAEYGTHGGGVFIGDSCRLVSDSVVFMLNGSAHSGGGLFCAYQSESELHRNVFLLNNALMHGGGLATGESAIHSETECIYAGNLVGDTLIPILQDLIDMLGGGKEWDEGIHGGAMAFGMYSHFDLQRNIVLGNVSIGSYHHGGGIHAGIASEGIIDSCIFALNLALGEFSHGGAIHMGVESVLDITRSVFTLNGSGGHGGGVMVGADSRVHIDGSVFAVNLSALHGGGYHACQRTRSILTDNAFALNISLQKGGGIALNVPDSSLVRDNLIAANIVLPPDSMINIVMDLLDQFLGKPSFAAAKDAGTSEGYNGGGISIFGSDYDERKNGTPDPMVEVENNLIAMNYAWGNGGGVFLGLNANEYFLDSYLRQNVIVNNQARHRGGGIAATSHVGPMLVNNTIAYNYCDSIGGGLHFGNYGGSMIVVNTILYGNESGTQLGNNVSMGYGDVYDLNFYYNLIEGDTGAFYVCDNYGYYGIYENNIDTLPYFFDPLPFAGLPPIFPKSMNDLNAMLAIGWSIPWYSPCKDAGSPNIAGSGLWAEDFYGSSRVAGNRIDIGAFEAIQQVTFEDLLPDTVCENGLGFKLVGGFPPGGQYGGPGVYQGYFYPAFAGLGPHFIYYSIIDPLNNVVSDSVKITIVAQPQVTLSGWDVCEGDPPYTLSGGMPAGGTYSGPYVSANIFDVAAAGPGAYHIEYTVENEFGCLTTEFDTLIVHPLPVVHIQPMNPVCYAPALLPLSGGTPVGGTYHGQFIDNNGKFDMVAAGTGTYKYYYSYTDPVTHCTNTDSAFLTIRPLPVVIASADVSVCPGACAVVSVSGAATYKWSTGATSPSITLCPQATTTFTVTGTGQNGCTASDQVTISVLPNVNVMISLAQTICRGDVVGLMAGGGGPAGTYAWSNGMSGSLIHVSPLVTTQYTVTVSTAQGCTGTGSVTVTVRDLPPAEAGGPYHVCEGNSIQLGASGGVQYAWSHGLSPVADPILAPMADMTVYVTVTGSNGCSATDSALVFVHGDPPLDLGPDVTICQKECVTLSAPPQYASYNWIQWDFTTIPPTMTQLPGNSQNMICPMNDVTVMLIVTDQYACVAIDTVLFTVKPVPLVDILADTLDIYLGNSDTFDVSLSGGVGPFSYQWAPPTYLSSSTVLEPVVQPLLDKAYTLTVTGANMCQASDWVYVRVDPAGNGIVGTLNYANNQSTPLTGMVVYLVENTSKAIVDSSMVDQDGFFSMTNILNGDYCLGVSPSSLYPWTFGGVNSLDGLEVAKHFAGFITLTGIQLDAANVDDLLGNVTMTDALRILQRYAGVINEFPKGDWTIDQPCLSLSGGQLAVLQLAALYTGDVNGSANPILKNGETLLSQERGTLWFDPGQELRLPLSLDGMQEITSASLTLRIPSGWVAQDVVCPEETGTLVWDQDGDLIRIAWYSMVPQQADPSVPFVYLILEPVGNLTTTVRVLPPSEVTDAMEQPVKDACLIFPSLKQRMAGGLSLSAWPVPAGDLIHLGIVMPEDAQVTLTVFNILGETVLQQVGDLLSGNRLMTLDVGGFVPGVYHIRAETAGASEVIQVVIAR